MSPPNLPSCSSTMRETSSGLISILGPSRGRPRRRLPVLLAAPDAASRFEINAGVSVLATAAQPLELWSGFFTGGLLPQLPRVPPDPGWAVAIAIGGHSSNCSQLRTICPCSSGRCKPPRGYRPNKYRVCHHYLFSIAIASPPARSAQDFLALPATNERQRWSPTLQASGPATVHGGATRAE